MEPCDPGPARFPSPPPIASGPSQQPPGAPREHAACACSPSLFLGQSLPFSFKTAEALPLRAPSLTCLPASQRPSGPSPVPPCPCGLLGSPHYSLLSGSFSSITSVTRWGSLGESVSFAYCSCPPPPVSSTCLLLRNFSA